MTVPSVAVAITKFLFGMCDCTVDSAVDTGDFSLVLGLFHVCRQAHVRSHVSSDMNWVHVHPGSQSLLWSVINITQTIIYILCEISLRFISYSDSLYLKDIFGKKLTRILFGFL